MVALWCQPHPVAGTVAGLVDMGLTAGGQGYERAPVVGGAAYFFLDLIAGKIEKYRRSTLWPNSDQADAMLGESHRPANVSLWGLRGWVGRLRESDNQRTDLHQSDQVIAVDWKQARGPITGQLQVSIALYSQQPPLAAGGRPHRKRGSLRVKMCLRRTLPAPWSPRPIRGLRHPIPVR